MNRLPQVTEPALAAHRLHAGFLTLLPRIELHARCYFRHLRCPHHKAEVLQEMQALAWLWYVRLVQRGKDPRDFAATFARLLARAVGGGRRLAGMLKARDVMNPAAQRRHHFRIEPLPTSRASHDQLYSAPHGQELRDAFEERLRDNTVTPVPDQVSFRLDFPAWRRTRSRRDRKIVDALMAGQRTLDVSRRFGLSPGRVSQLRQAFHSDWQRFNGELAPAAI